MKNVAKRKLYEAPFTKHIQVEMESAFCGSVYTDGDKEQKITIEEHGFSQTEGFYDENAWEN